MKTKLIYTEDFERRFANAAKNGSTVCADILKAIKTPDNIKDGVKVNYITTVKVNNGSYDGFTRRSIKVTYCSKDFTNDNNPEKGSPVGMWRRENRAQLDLVRFVDLFKSLEGIHYSSEDYAYAAEVLSIDEPLVCKILSGMRNIEKCYAYSNYAPIVSSSSNSNTLWSSCMRSEETAAVAGDFYANFCGAKIVGVFGVNTGAVYGRAILWPEIIVQDEKGAFLDRVYFTHDCIRVMMYEFAKTQGVKFRKYQNTYDSKVYFVKFSDPTTRIRAGVRIAVPQIKWHKAGSPYTDTFSWVNYENEHFYLSNYCTDYSVVATDCTGTTGAKLRDICPVCGMVHSRGTALCRTCADKYMKNTIVGPVYTGKVNKKGEPILPKKYVEAEKHIQSL